MKLVTHCSIYASDLMENYEQIRDQLWAMAMGIA